MRLEKKFVLLSKADPATAFNFKKFGFDETYEARNVNSIYFDDSNLSCFYENLEGNANRTKMRVRWYGKSNVTDAQHLTLEIKWKQSGSGSKDKFQIATPSSLTNFRAHCYRELYLQLNNNNEASLGRALKILSIAQPTVLVSYSRRYYSSPALECRLTVDECLTAMPLKPLLRVNGTVVKESVRIVELKYPVHQQTRIEQYISSVPYNSRSFSKYSWAVSQFNGQILAHV